MQCNKCGNILAEGATFCPNCGAPVEQNMGTTSQNVTNDTTINQSEVTQEPNLMSPMMDNVQTNTQSEMTNQTNSQPDTLAVTTGTPDLMSAMPNTNQNSVQPEMPNVVSNPQPNMTNQTTTNIQPGTQTNSTGAPDLMSPMTNSVQTNTQPAMPNNMQSNNVNSNLNFNNNQPIDQFPNSQQVPPMGQMPSGPMNQPSVKKPINKKVFIIGGIVAVVLVAVIICFLLFSNNGTIVNVEGLNVWVPNNYEEDSQYGYDKIYKSKENDVLIGVMKQSAYGVTLDQFMDVFDDGQGLGSMECEKGTKQTIKGQEWAHYSCSTNSQKSNLYVTVKDDDAYIVEISSKNDAENKLASIDKNISKNLEFTE